MSYRFADSLLTSCQQISASSCFVIKIKFGWFSIFATSARPKVNCTNQGCNRTCYQEFKKWSEKNSNVANEILGFRREIDENCALLEYYAACSGNPYRRFGTIYPSPLQGSNIIGPWRWTERFSRNVGNEIPLHVAYKSWRAQLQTIYRVSPPLLTIQVIKRALWLARHLCGFNSTVL